MSPKLTPRALRLVRAAKALHGDRYATAMAELMGLSQTYITLMAAGTRPVSDEVERLLLIALEEERKRLKLVSAALAEIIKEIKDERGWHDD
jgi:hypothetical protein